MTDEEFKEAQAELEDSLKLCGCGNIESALLYILDGLEFINEKPPTGATGRFDSVWLAWFKQQEARIKAHYGSDGAMYFFYYMMDTLDISEHVRSVPGWLTEEGEQVLTDLRKWKEEYAKRNRE